MSHIYIYIYISRTIQQYSPPGEWIMCELGVFPIFLENDLLKVPKILALTFFKARKDLEGFNTAKILAQEKFGPKTKFIYEKTNGQHLTSRNRIAIFVSASCEERNKKPLSAINFARQQKTTKLFFSSQVRKEFKLLAVPFKSLRC